MNKRPRVRKTRSDSPQGKQEMVVALAKGVVLPDFIELTEGAKVFWDVVVRARPANEWSESDLTIAADLCECMSDMAENAVLLRQEGYVIENFKGMPVQNPRNQVMEVLTRRKVCLFRMLQIHSRGVGGELREKEQQRAKAAGVAATTGAAFEQDDDDLLARPVH